MTPNATRFVGPLTFQALSGHPVLVDLLDPASEAGYGHLELARRADLLVVAPATANLLARLRAGMGDDAVTTTALACTCPVLLAPAMNTRMWEGPAVQENLAALRARGWHVVGPSSGELADGDVGEGRLADPAEIAAAAARILGPRDLAGRRVLVTAGPTREPLDPVRYLSNPSTGKMGLRGGAGRGPPGSRGVARVRSHPRFAIRTGSGWFASPRPRRWPPPSWARPGAGPARGRRSGLRLPPPRAARRRRGRRPTAPRRSSSSGPPTSWPRWASGWPGDRTPRCWWGSPRRPRTWSRTPARSCAASTATSWWRTRSARPGAGFGSDRNRVSLVGPAEVEEVEGTKGAVADSILNRVVPLLDARRPRS